MALIIDDPEAEYLAHALVKVTGETLQQAVITALQDCLRHLQEKGALDEVMATIHHCVALPELDPRPADEIIGYDEHGLPA